MNEMTSVEQTFQEQEPYSNQFEQNSPGESSSEFTVISQTASMTGTVNDSLPDVHVSLMTATYDLTPDEVRALLKDLLQENQDLKDSLNQNNKKMQQLLKTMSVWQEQVEQNYSNYKLIIEGLQKTVSSLQGEKSDCHKTANEAEDESSKSDSCSDCINLRKTVEILKNDLEAAEKSNQESTVALKCQETLCMQIKQHVIDLSKEKDGLSTDYKLLEREKRDLTAMNNQLQIQLNSLNFEELKKSNSVITQDIEHGYTLVYHADEKPESEAASSTVAGPPQSLKDTLIGLHEANSRIIQLDRDLMEEKHEVTYLKSVVEKKDKQLDELTQQLQNLHSSPAATKNDNAVVNNSALSEQGESFKDEFASSQEKMQVAFSYIQKYKERCDSLTTQLQIYQAKLQDVQASDGIIEKLQVEVAGLHALLAQEKVNRHEDKKNLQAARLQFEQLCKDYESLMHKWNAYEKDQDTKRQQIDALKKISERQHQESLDAVTAQFVTLQEELAAKSNELSLLKNDIHVLKQETENIPILRAQVELYKQDFQAEQTARRAVQDEVEKLKHEIHSLRSHNQQLLDEINAYSQVHVAQIRSSHARNADKEDGHHRHRHRRDEKIKNVQKESFKSHNKSHVSFHEQTRIMTCPRCELGFTELQALENHVEQCLNEGPF